MSTHQETRRKTRYASAYFDCILNANSNNIVALEIIVILHLVTGPKTEQRARRLRDYCYFALSDMSQN